MPPRVSRVTSSSCGRENSGASPHNHTNAAGTPNENRLHRNASGSAKSALLQQQRRLNYFWAIVRLENGDYAALVLFFNELLHFRRRNGCLEFLELGLCFITVANDYNVAEG